MKKTLSVIAWTLALNFLAAAGGIAYLYKSGAIDRDRVQQIKAIVFPPATQPAEEKPPERDPTTRPTLRLEEMLAKVSGRSASEQVEFIQRTFDSQTAILESRFAELERQRNTLKEVQKQLTKERGTLVADQKALAAAQEQQKKLLTDQGFQDTLGLYSTMPAKQVKTIFMSMNDDTLIQYLRAMEPRTATKIAKEFKTPDEVKRIGAVMEKMRQAQAATTP